MYSSTAISSANHPNADIANLATNQINSNSVEATSAVNFSPRVFVCKFSYRNARTSAFESRCQLISQIETADYVFMGLILFCIVRVIVFELDA